MKYQFKILYLLVIVHLFCTPIVYGQVDQFQGDSLTEIKQKALSRYLNLIRLDNIAYYGFSSVADLERIELGIPIQIITFKEDFYNDKEFKNIDYLNRTSEYRIPLFVDDTIRSFLIVCKINSDWIVTGIGGNMLAKRINECLLTYNIDTNRSIKLVREGLTKSDYLLIDFKEQGQEEFLYPLSIFKHSCSTFSGPEQLQKTELLELLHYNLRKQYK